MLRAGVALAAAGALALALEALRRGTLYDLSFPSGWFLALAIAVGVVTMHALGAGPTARRMRVQMVLTAVTLGLLLFHVDFHLPRGWLETALGTVLLSAAVSTVYGAELVLRGRVDVEGPEVGAWMRRHATLNAVLIVLTAFHGMMVHAHGAMAYALLGASGP